MLHEHLPYVVMEGLNKVSAGRAHGCPSGWVPISLLKDGVLRQAIHSPQQGPDSQKDLQPFHSTLVALSTHHVAYGRKERIQKIPRGLSQRKAEVEALKASWPLPHMSLSGTAFTFMGD